MPFTSVSDIKIKPLEPNERVLKTMVDEYQIVCWRFIVEPRNTHTVTFKYAIEHPAERPVAKVEQEGVKGELPV